MLLTPTIANGFADELTKVAKLNYRDLAGIGAGTGAMLNLGARAKHRLGMDYHPEQKGRTLTGDAAKGATAALAAGALLSILTNKRV